MAVNVLRGNVFVLDSASLYLTNDSVSGKNQSASYLGLNISGVAIYGTGTSVLALSLASANSTDIIHLSRDVYGTEHMEFSPPLRVSERLYVRLITAGTGYIYLA